MNVACLPGPPGPSLPTREGLEAEKREPTAVRHAKGDGPGIRVSRTHKHYNLGSE